MSAITDTILDQMGGLGLLRAMLGVHSVLVSETIVYFNIKGCKKINRVKVEYREATDLYRVKFYHYNSRTLELKVIRNYDDVFCEDLVTLMESETGLVLRKVRVTIV